jgi:hypothetical protein
LDWRERVAGRSLVGMDDFDAVWARIRECAGQEFTTVRGLPFSYSLSGDHLLPTRANIELPKAHFRKAYDLMPIKGPGDINHVVLGPAYIFAILTDERIRS